MKKAFTVLIAVIIFAVLGMGLLAVGYDGDISAIPGIGWLFEKTDSISAERMYSEGVSDELPDIDPGDWNYKLVNADNPISEDFYVATGVNADGYLFDARAISALDEMLNAGRAEGLQLALTSAYRTYDYQKMLFEDKVSRVMSETGAARSEAEQLAAQEVAFPGTSEHNLGLAADIVCEYYGILDEGYAETPEAVWLREHCAEFGFILRYDKDKEDITKIMYEPWHFRYVGTEAAQYIMANGLCLEEFLELYE